MPFLWSTRHKWVNILCAKKNCRRRHSKFALLFFNALIALWVKFSADDILKYFSYFSQKTGYDISCKLSPNNLHEMSNPVFGGKIRNMSSICHLLKMPRVVKVKRKKPWHFM